MVLRLKSDVLVVAVDVCQRLIGLEVSYLIKTSLCVSRLTLCTGLMTSKSGLGAVTSRRAQHPITYEA